MERKIINPWSWQDSFGFVQANEFSGHERVVMCAGQTSVDDEGNPLHEGDMRAQLAMALENLETVLEQAGVEPSTIMRLNFYTTDVDAFMEAAEVSATWLARNGCRPASTLLGVARLAYPELLIEIEATAVA